MTLLNSILDILIYFSILAVGLIPLERVFLAHNQKIVREEWFTDLLFFLGGNLLWTRITIYVLDHIRDFFIYHDFYMIHSKVENWPFMIQVVFVLFLSDLLIYWAHRFSHKFDILWRFHKVHHTAIRLDWLAAFREHPLDNIYTRVIVNLPALLFGFSLESISFIVLFRGVWGNFIHSNTSFGLGPLKYFLGSPRLHHWHHDFERNSQCNFANLMPLMDVFFGTFYDPGKMPKRYGIDDPMPHNYLAQIFLPLIPEDVYHWFYINKN